MRKTRAVLLRKVAQVIRGTSLARTLTPPDPNTLEQSVRKLYRRLKEDWKSTPVSARGDLVAFHKQIILQAT